MNTGIVYGNIVIQFRYFFVFGVFAKQLKAGLAKTLSPTLGGDNNIPDLSCTTRLLLFLVKYALVSPYMGTALSLDFSIVRENQYTMLFLQKQRDSWYN